MHAKTLMLQVSTRLWTVQHSPRPSQGFSARHQPTLMLQLLEAASVPVLPRQAQTRSSTCAWQRLDLQTSFRACARLLAAVT